MATNDQPMSPGRDETSGRYTAEYDPQDFIEAIRELGGSASTTEVADAVGCNRRTSHLRLTELDDDGTVDGRRVGQAYLWTVTDGESGDDADEPARADDDPSDYVKEQQRKAAGQVARSASERHSSAANEGDGDEQEEGEIA
jgi:hypothetical protein